MVRQYRYIDFQDRKEISTRYLNGDRVADIADGLGVTNRYRLPGVETWRNGRA